MLLPLLALRAPGVYSLLRPRLHVVLRRLIQADQAVAVGVDLAELLLGAEELRPRHVAVAVAVHLVEPGRALRGLARSRTTHPVRVHGEHGPIPRAQAI